MYSPFSTSSNISCAYSWANNLRASLEDLEITWSVFLNIQGSSGWEMLDTSHLAALEEARREEGSLQRRMAHLLPRKTTSRRVLKTLNFKRLQNRHWKRISNSCQAPAEGSCF